MPKRALLVLLLAVSSPAAVPVRHAAADAPLALTSVAPALVDPLGGTRIVLRGGGLSGATGATIGGVPAASLSVLDDATLVALSGPVAAGSGLDVTVLRGVEQATLPGAVEAWSPAEIPGARVFDAATGVTGNEGASSYEWQRLTTTIAPDWLQRDGNTLTYLPSTGRFWMVAGWNPYPPPDGFDHVDPALGLVPHATTNEVWSSGDGVRWRKDLADDHPGFDRRHGHATLLWRDKLWIIGGDWWRHAYNHDVVSSPDGIAWTVELTQTPWPDRAVLVAGVYDDKLWVVGGQTLDGPREDFVYHNDVWSSVDGVNWVQVAADAPASATRWSGRGSVNELVEFNGRMWLVGGARYRDDAVGSSFFAEVWSTTDGVTWTQHAAPPWQGRIWPDVRVWDGKLWLMFGHDNLANLNDTWFTEDGETWTAFAPDRNIHPGSHAQGVAVADDFMLYAGGNYSFGLGPTIRDTDRSAWRLKAFRGTPVDAWTDRGHGGVTVTASGAARPLLDPDALGPGIAGVQFDGSSSVLELAASELQPGGRSVFWVGRAPWMPTPLDWDTPPTLNPLWTVVGDGDEQYCAAGLAGGGLFYTSSSPTAGWEAAAAGSGLQEGPGSVRFQGFTHTADGTLQGWIDGAPAGAATNVGYTPFHGWSRIGAGGYAPVSYTGYPGSLGAVVILPHAVDAATVARMQQWAHGRFATPACAPAGKPTLSLSALTRPSGSQKVKLAAVLSLPDPLAPPADPVLDGARIEVRDAEGTIADVLLPPGAYDPLARTGWKANGARTSFTFLQPSTAGLVTRASVKLSRAKDGSREIRVQAAGKGALATTATNLPLDATIDLRPLDPARARCAALRFPGPASPRCTARGGGASIGCR